MLVCLSVKAVHLELVSDLTMEAFIAALCQFIARRGYPSFSHGTNFVGTNRELNELNDFLCTQQVQGTISVFCHCKNIEWRFIPERAPHFGGLCESAVKSTRPHLSRVVGSVKLTFKEFCTILTRVKVCLNSHPLTPVNAADDSGYKFSHLVTSWSANHLLLYLIPHFRTDLSPCCNAGTFVKT